MAEDRPIIIKKVKKVQKAGHHGGAWKVAYADFVTAMMALFLVLWLVAMLSIETRDAVAQYFRSYTIFEGQEAGGGKGMSIMKGNPIRLDPDPGDNFGTSKSDTRIALELGQVVEAQLMGLDDQVMIFTTKNGVRIEMVDSENTTMFDLGSANLLDNGRKVLSVLAAPLAEMPYTISIEGHTDAHKYSREDYSNWELAADRANAARRELVDSGFDADRITQVTSFADAALLNAEDPLDPKNRRVSILVETHADSATPPMLNDESRMFGDPLDETFVDEAE